MGHRALYIGLLVLGHMQQHMFKGKLRVKVFAHALCGGTNTLHAAMAVSYTHLDVYKRQTA